MELNYACKAPEPQAVAQELFRFPPCSILALSHSELLDNHTARLQFGAVQIGLARLRAAIAMAGISLCGSVSGSPACWGICEGMHTFKRSRHMVSEPNNLLVDCIVGRDGS